MKSILPLIVTCFVLTGCFTPLSQAPNTEIEKLSVSQICARGQIKGEVVLAEKIVSKRGETCDEAKKLCMQAGLKPNSSKWADCYINAKGVIAQQEATAAAYSAANQARIAAIQNNINANRPRTCYGGYNSVTCY